MIFVYCFNKVPSVFLQIHKFLFAFILERTLLQEEREEWSVGISVTSP